MMGALAELLADIRRGYRDAELAALRMEVTALRAQLDHTTTTEENDR